MKRNNLARLKVQQKFIEVHNDLFQKLYDNEKLAKKMYPRSFLEEKKFIRPHISAIAVEARAKIGYSKNTYDGDIVVPLFWKWKEKNNKIPEN